jgi:epoxyqueuosine reductase
MHALEDRLKQQAHVLGFELAGIASAVPADSFDRLSEWLAQGFAGEMSHMHQQAEARRHPASILPEVRSVVMVGMNYQAREPLSAGSRPSSLSLMGKVARYARGADYHDVLWERLNQLLAWVQQQVPDCRGRGVVDTAPLLERDFARRAGLGWFGKNTMLIDRTLGSYILLGALLLDCELQPDVPHDKAHCGTCRACLAACPTQAFAGPGLLDSRRCLSYLTIELKGHVPEDLRREMNEWLFGCDICQEVCPWNRKFLPGREPALHPRPELAAIDLVEVLSLSEEEYRSRFRGTALLRARRRGLLRNAALILGNRGDTRALPALRKLLTDSEPTLRAAASWAIGLIEKRSIRTVIT